MPEERVRAVVVGSGAAGVFAARALRGVEPLVLDVGRTPGDEPLPGTGFYDLRDARDTYDDVLGDTFSSLTDRERAELSPKLRGPRMRFVAGAEEGLPRLSSEGFRGVTSYAEGGLANAWGAQVYRFDDGDLAGWPLSAAALEPHYDRVTEDIGVSGAEDDLAAFHVSARGLLPPAELGALGRRLLTRYERRRAYFQRRHVRLGRPRLAVLTEDRHGREACTYDNLEFHWPRIPAVYTPAFTLREMVAAGSVHYRPGVLVERFEETDGGVRVHARRTEGGAPLTFAADVLVLALGALNTPRLVLHGRGDTATRLPLVENACSFVPLFCPGLIGAPLEARTLSSQLNLVYDGPLWPERVIGMLYALEGLLRSDILLEFPLAGRDALAASRWLLPACMLLQVFYPGAPSEGGWLGVDERGDLRAELPAAAPLAVEPHLLRVFRRAGFLGVRSTIRPANPGGSIHYGGALPMLAEPRKPYETDTDGRLGGSRRVFVADSSSFPRLPAKNLTLTIMANALRVGAAALRRAEEGP